MYTSRYCLLAGAGSCAWGLQNGDNHLRQKREACPVTENGGNEKNERKIHAVYAGTLRSGYLFPQLAGNGHGVPDFVYVCKGISQGSLLLGEPVWAGLLLFSYVFPELRQTV
jgi:hypothetical protein